MLPLGKLLYSGPEGAKYNIKLNKEIHKKHNDVSESTATVEKTHLNAQYAVSATWSLIKNKTQDVSRVGSWELLSLLENLHC